MNSVEEIIYESSLLRKHWLPVEEAIQRVVQFERDFGSAHLALARHVALPSILTPELVNLIRINFLEKTVEWVAESDLLLSPLCYPIGEGLFEVEPGVREVLLIQLKFHTSYGLKRLEELANFLQNYIQAQLAKKLPQNIRRTYQWISDAYLAPDKAVTSMLDFLYDIKPEERLAKLAAQIQVGKTVELVAGELEQSSLQVELEDLVWSTRILASYWYGDPTALARSLQRNLDSLDAVTDVLSSSIANWIVTTEEVTGSSSASIAHFGWIPDLTDRQDYQNDAPIKTTEALPSSVDLRPACPPVYHQGQLGSVTANAIAAALEFCLIKQDVSPIFTPSRLFIYYNERGIEGTVDADSGSTIKDGIKSVETLGVCPEEMWPYDIAKFAERPPDACYQAALQYRIFRFKRVKRNLVQMKMCLASGYPFIFGFTVYESFLSEQVKETGHAPIPQPGEQRIGGHAALVVGYDDANQWFIVRNSWGTDWGMQGYFTLPYAYIKQSNLTADFWTVRIKEARGRLRRQRPKSGITCLVTLHGIGFEQPPLVGVDNSGYADPLHQHLKKYLEEELNDDPNRARGKPGDNGAIYVESLWPKRQGMSREEGMKRLGVWYDNKQGVDTTDAPLLDKDDKDGSISHVALTYSNMEPLGAELGATFAHFKELIHTTLTTTRTRVERQTAPPSVNQIVSSLRPRIDLHPDSVRQLGQQEQASPPWPTVLTYLENDVASYVSNNEERERVRSFVSEALTRLAYREDVDNIVLNTHSNGTVIALDILHNLPLEVTNKIKAFVTAGSPLRKYVDLFHWGSQVQTIYPFEPWYNFWDRRDPVADPLNPPISWHVGDKIVPSAQKLFSRIDLVGEVPFWIKVEDREVNNVANSHGGGLQAHNYWDNEVEFVKQLCNIVRAIADI